MASSATHQRLPGAVLVTLLAWAWLLPGTASAAPAPKPPVSRPPAAQTEAKGPVAVSGGADLVSSYAQRGITLDPDSSTPALQPWFDVALPWGFYLGYWGSTTDFPEPVSTGPGEPVVTGRFDIENDLTAGWSLDLGQAELRVGATWYVYLQSQESNATELLFEIEAHPRLGGTELGNLVFAWRTMVDDSDWGNAGDTYLVIGHRVEPGDGWMLGADLALHGYAAGPNLPTTERFAFRHLDLHVRRGIETAGLYLQATWTVGGVDRVGEQQPDLLVWSTGWSF